MGSKVKQMDEYVCAEMIKSDIELNYDNFYKDDLIRLLKICRKLYKGVQEKNERLLELCMYALISSTKIYNHELANNTKQAFMKIIKENIDDDTYILREKIKKYWNGDK